MFTPQENIVLADRALEVCSRQANYRTREDNINDLVGLYIHYSSSTRTDLAQQYKAQLEHAIAEWRKTRGW